MSTNVLKYISYLLKMAMKGKSNLYVLKGEGVATVSAFSGSAGE